MGTDAPLLGDQPEAPTPRLASREDHLGTVRESSTPRKAGGRHWVHLSYGEAYTLSNTPKGQLRDCGSRERVHLHLTPNASDPLLLMLPDLRDDLTGGPGLLTPGILTPGLLTPNSSDPLLVVPDLTKTGGSLLLTPNNSDPLLLAVPDLRDDLTGPLRRPLHATTTGLSETSSLLDLSTRNQPARC